MLVEILKITQTMVDLIKIESIQVEFFIQVQIIIQKISINTQIVSEKSQ